MPLQRIDDEENFIIKRSAITGNGTDKMQSLALLISPELRQRFLAKLFRGDSADFDALLIQLEVAPDWMVAHRLIEQHFNAYHINPYQREATRFSNLIYKRYFPKDEHI